MRIFDLMVLLEAPERPAQVRDQPWLEVRGLGHLPERGLGAASDDSAAISPWEREQTLDC